MTHTVNSPEPPPVIGYRSLPSHVVLLLLPLLQNIPHPPLHAPLGGAQGDLGGGWLTDGSGLVGQEARQPGPRQG